MSNNKSTEPFYKRLIPMGQSKKPDDGKRNHPSAYHQNAKNNQSDPIDHPMSLPSNSSLSPKRGAIDAQTYVDVQSNGLTQRIVRYDEENRKTPTVFNRVYKRVGDFPIVHLDKPKLMLTPKRSIGHLPIIGQPDPYVNRANIRAEILRNGTMMPTVSLDRRENVDNVLDPLDALKEISRKRIHCEDTISPIQSTLDKDATDSNPSPNCNISKRQRIAPVNTPSSNETNKRGHYKCNEILSSLSSSSHMLSHSLKRSKEESRSNSISPPQAKRLQTEKETETAIVDIPSATTVPKPIEKVVVPEVAEKTHPTEPARPKLTLFNVPHSKTSTAPRVNSRRNDECNISFVKPRPMTERYRQSVENWFKVKPADERRLALMLKCLSGEVDDDSDTVDSGKKDGEIPKAANPIADSSAKPLSEDKNPIEKDVAATVAPTTQVSTTSISLPTKPVVTFNTVVTTISPLLPVTPVQTTATIVQPSTTVVQPPAATTVEERKGGFSFPLTTKETTTSQPAPTAVVSSTPPTISSPLLPQAATVTPSIVVSTPSVVSKDPLPTLNPSVSFTFHPSKPKETSPSAVVTAVEPTKTITFGAVANTKNTPVFGTSAPPAETTKVMPSSTLEEPKTTFGGFGQTTSTAGSINFGKNLVASTAAPAFAFGSVTSSNAFNKAEPPTFGSIQTSTQQSTPSEKTNQPNKPLTFSTNAQTSAFGSILSNATPSNAQKQTDPRVAAIANTSAPNQATNSTIGSSSFVFAATTNPSATIKTTQSTLPSASSFNVNPVNSTPNIFGASQQQSSTGTSIFGTPATTTPSMFGQTPTVNSIKSPEPEKNVVAANIFSSSSTAKPASSTFNFSATNQPNTSNIFGSQSVANSGTSNAFSFGGSIPKSDSSSAGASKPFSFGGNSVETKPVAFGAGKSVAPTFGSGNVIDSTKSVGFPATNQTSSTNLFTNTSTNEIPKAFSFGANNNPSSATPAPSFGGTNSTFGTSTAFGTAAPTFGSAKANTAFTANAAPAFGGASSTPTFGSANSTSSPPAFGSSTQSFGSANVTSAPPAFSGVNAAPSFATTNSAPVFGSPNTTSAFTNANAASPFGSTPSFVTANAAPTFGSSSATPSFATANATPSFGSSSATPSFGTANAAPSFGSSSANPSFGGALSFGGNNAAPTFGGTGFTANNSGAPSFGSSSNGSGGSVFGGNSGTPAFTTSTGSGDVNRTFNFTGNADPAPSPVPNLFNIGPGSSSAPRGRTIRTASRRTYR